jgi:hypothetical protein
VRHCFDHFICGGRFSEPKLIADFSSLVFWLPETQDCRLADSTNEQYITFVSCSPLICRLSSSSHQSKPRLTEDEEQDIVEVFNCSFFKMKLKKLCHDSADVKPIIHDLLQSVKRNESKTDCQLRWGLILCQCSVLSIPEPEASPLLRDLRVDLRAKVNHPNIPGQAHVKFADGDEHETPFPCNPKERKAKARWLPFS